MANMSGIGCRVPAWQRHIKRLLAAGWAWHGFEVQLGGMSNGHVAAGRGLNVCWSISVSWNYGHDLAIMLLKYAPAVAKAKAEAEADRGPARPGLAWPGPAPAATATAASMANCKTFVCEICLRDKNKIVHLK